MDGGEKMAAKKAAEEAAAAEAAAAEGVLFMSVSEVEAERLRKFRPKPK